MRNSLRMSYRRANKQPFQVNSERCIILRQQYALVHLQALLSGQRVINIDESWINETTFFRKTWAPKMQASNVRLKSVTPRLALIAAIDTDGRVWYSLNQANTNSSIMLLFLTHLCNRLDREQRNWRRNTAFLLDGARYHTSDETREFLKKLKVKVIYSAPYSYTAASIERLFAAIKLGELNPQDQPTGKK
jgi:hypothetical protein